MAQALSHWILHRQRLLGLESHAALADAAGISRDDLNSLIERGTLEPVGRSARGYLARALEISVRDLENLASGKIDWLSDARRVDWTRATPDCLRVRNPQRSTDAPLPIPCPQSLGVPIVGRIMPAGSTQLYDEWSSQDVPRLPVRYAAIPDAFALQTSGPVCTFPADTNIVFRALPPGELKPSESALITRGDAEGESLFCYIEHEDDLKLRLISMTGEAGPVIPMEMVLRAGRVIGSHRVA